MPYHFPPHFPETAKPWKSEKLYFQGDDYFKDFLKAVDHARRSIDLETYIFEKGRLADRIVSAFARAVKRGVKVRLLVDGVGSPDFASHYGPQLSKAGVEFRVYRSWPVFFSTAFKKFRFIRPIKSYQVIHAIWKRGKHRDHRKQSIVDGHKVWLGSFNISDWHLQRQKGKATWRDTGIGLTEVQSPAFRLAFEVTWEDRWPRRFRSPFRKMLIQWLSHDVQESPIRITANRRLRRSFRKELLELMKGAEHRIWITTPYLIPTGALLRSLIDSARKGCDVRILVPGESDVPMVRWASMAFYPRLLRSGCRLFEYQTSVLHAKTTLVDSWVLVGSSNLDQRSLRKDLEINVIPQWDRSRRQLERQFKSDLGQSKEVKLGDLQNYPLWMRLISPIFFHFRDWF